MMPKLLHPALLWLLLAMLLPARARCAELPEWIWHDNHGAKPADHEVRYFRKLFRTPRGFARATLMAVADDHLEVYVNGRQVLVDSGWDYSMRVDVSDDLHAGDTNLIAIKGTNVSGPAGVILKLELLMRNGTTNESVMSDTTWRSSAKEFPHWNERGFVESPTSWTPVISEGKLGSPPWGDPFKRPAATSADSLKLLPGFKVELIRSAEPGEGSWISMAVDPRGRLIISPQEGVRNMLRVTLTGEGRVGKVEKINQPVGSAMGLLYAFNSLYVNGRGPNGLGLYRLRDTGVHDRYDSVKLVKLIEGAGGEHGSHAVVLGADKHLYIVSGNFTSVPKDIAADSPHRNYAEDQLLPRGNDGNGFGNGVRPPGGFLLRTDYEGRKWQLFAAGMRNTYDFAVNPEGELIGFDSDMEWDWGMPWYRPIRIFHLVSGGDYGFREGTGKWPEYYPDSLPATVNVGIGSPTGMKFGTDSKFPPKYKKALFALDWAYGRIFAVHLTPSGASYTATFETFLKGKPLNLTDIEFGGDGAMYFITGGRGTQSGLYRVTYTGAPVPETPPTQEELAQEKEAARARALRHELEKFHGRPDPKAVDFAWPHLDSDDRFIRYAARIAIESQPMAQWQERALAETRTNAGLTALLALARCGGRDTQRDLLVALAKFRPAGLSEEQKLDKLRVIELSFIRQGRPTPGVAQAVMDRLDQFYPASTEKLNREVSELLIYLRAPDVVPKTLALLDAAPTLEEQIHYIFHLRKMTNGWTMDERAHYFAWLNDHRQGGAGRPTLWHGENISPAAAKDHHSAQHPPGMLQWFKDADRDYSDGSSYPNFISNFRRDAIESLSDAEMKELDTVLNPKTNAPPALAVQPHKFVKYWTMEELLPLLDQAGKGRNFARGKEAFAAAQCLQCHRFGNEGGAVGPELTAVSSRFSRRDILESIILPSKVVSEQYQNIIFMLKDGDDVTGRIAEEDDQKVVVISNPLTQTKVDVRKSDIVSRMASHISPMPEGLTSGLTQDEILDLLAYLESGGKPDAPAFAKSDNGGEAKVSTTSAESSHEHQIHPEPQNH